MLKNDGFHAKNDGFRAKNDGFHAKVSANKKHELFGLLDANGACVYRSLRIEAIEMAAFSIEKTEKKTEKNRKNSAEKRPFPFQSKFALPTFCHVFVGSSGDGMLSAEEQGKVRSYMREE